MSKSLSCFLLLITIAAALAPIAASQGDAVPLQSAWQLGQAALQARKYEEAEAAFRRVIALDPSLAEAYVNLGLTLHLQKKQEEAIKIFEHALKLQPGLSHAYLFLGINLFNLNRISKAIPVLTKYVSLAPNDPQGHYYLGLTYTSQNDCQKAIQSLETASTLAPKDVDILYHLAQSYITQANLIVRRLAEFNPSLPLLKNWQKDQGADIAELIRQSPSELSSGGQLILEGMEREALLKLRPHLERAPPNEQAEQMAAAAYANLYLRTTQRFYQIEPDSFRIHQLVAAYYEKTHQTEKAIGELKEALRLNPNVRGVHFTLGSIYREQAQLELAVQEFIKELEIASPYPGTRLQLAQTYLTLQQPQKALPELLTLQRENPDDGEVDKVLGKTYSELGRIDKAAESFELAIAKGETTHAVYYQLANIYRKAGKTELAAKYFEASKKAAAAERTRERARIEKAIEAQRRQQGERN